MTGDYPQLYTDASGGIGYGACEPEWFFGKWPSSWLTFYITVLELYPIVAAVELWRVSWANSSICFFTDNEALVAIINKQTSREPCVMVLQNKFLYACVVTLTSLLAMYQVNTTL